ncbi:uncharacterized protein LOC131893405 [Tigriopus californicus]|uniref:uncharacterized protein LOC131893405 n=1 Tax=Tigriopus californicus TaxID=6832 RepID=UPI0027DA5106|nr:uncharacterized protein LOC131893405 [Tigriopus californicus]XP_059099406.1 uncharacterized protein LOC131893405 [Tigriopus californicus]XP_059099407.1 uncharacterized protein LOC131893405 [Tigriopus californicus]
MEDELRIRRESLSSSPRVARRKPPKHFYSPRTRRSISVTAITSGTAELVKPRFRIGGQTDPGRFVSQHHQDFYIVGFHDDERARGSKEPSGQHPSAVHRTKSTGDVEDLVDRSHPMRLSFGSMNGVMRTTLSPVREQSEQAGAGGLSPDVQTQQGLSHLKQLRVSWGWQIRICTINLFFLN